MGLVKVFAAGAAVVFLADYVRGTEFVKTATPTMAKLYPMLAGGAGILIAHKVGLV